jgi:hypothetical protein
MPYNISSLYPYCLRSAKAAFFAHHTKKQIQQKGLLHMILEDSLTNQIQHRVQQVFRIHTACQFTVQNCLDYNYHIQYLL